MSAVNAELINDSPEAKRRDWQIMALIGAAHSCSHFFQLVIPTLYLSLAAQFGYSFAELGTITAIFFVMSGVGQSSSGFVVDRIGATPVLYFGLAGFVVSGALLGLANGYLMLALAAAIGGVANGVFHPADYSILNLRISPSRLGHAFSTHGFTGNLGWAITPVFMSTIIYLANWRVAAFAAGGLVGLVLIIVILGRRLLEEPTNAKAAASVQTVKSQAESAAEHDLANASVLKTLKILSVQPALWGAFFFFMFTSIALSAVQNYTIPMLDDVYGIDKVLAGTTLSAYMAAAALGMIAGGFLVGATPNNERTIAISLFLAGGLLVLLASGVLIPAVAMVVVGLAGFCAGVATPSRDMLIRQAAPKGATGTVYGLVYSGMDVGASLGPIGFGIMLDAGFNQGPWLGAAMAFVIAALLAYMVARAVMHKNQMQVA